MLELRGVKHEVLNAKNHAREAEIVAQAGPLRRRDHRHEHGRPRHGHPAGRQPGVPGPPRHAPGGRGRGDHRGRHRAQRGRGAGGAGRPQALQRAEQRIQKDHRRGARPRGGRGRPAHHRHRAARIPPHRQPAARPRRPPGRPGLLPVLHLPGGRPDAPLRRRADRRHGGPAGPEGRRAPDRGAADQADRERPEAHGEPQLRDPQARAAVRRRDEPAARADLRPAPPGAGGRERAGEHPEHGGPRDRRRRGPLAERRRSRRSGTGIRRTDYLENLCVHHGVWRATRPWAED